MPKGINYWAFPPGDDGSPADPLDAMRVARGLGFDCFELTVDAAGPISLATTAVEAERVRHAAESLGLQLVTLATGLAWSTSPTHPDPAVRDRAMQQYEKVLEIASWLGAETVLYIPGMVSAVFVPEFVPQPYDRVDAWARESLQRLLSTAGRLGVRIAVENVWNRYLLSPLEMRAFIDSFGSPLVGAYFDVGNVMLYGHPQHWIQILGPRILAVHLKDFRVSVGNLDGFVDLLSGDVDYPAVMCALRQTGYDGPLTVEIVPGKAGAVEKAAAALTVIERMWATAAPRSAA
jgi:L-ribulose-5-phosphate 3-epimerase